MLAKKADEKQGTKSIKKKGRSEKKPIGEDITETQEKEQVKEQKEENSLDEEIDKILEENLENDEYSHN